MDAIDARALVRAMPICFLPNKAGNMKAVVFLNLSGPGGGKWGVTISEGRCRVREGVPEKWNVQLKARDDTFIRVLAGGIYPVVAVITLKLVVLGNPLLALRFQNCFARPREFTVKGILDIMPQLFKPERTGSASAAVQFEVDGPGGGIWTVRINSGRCWVQQGKSSDARTVITGDGMTIRRMLMEPRTAMSEFLKGSIKITGNLALAIRFQSWFL